jgi:2-methylisocitrate lyase-like PEP mutase family enzyme
VAASLGYEDGATPAAEMFAAVARITRSVSVPVSADVEGGYGLAAEELVGRVLDAGAVGVNLEDSEDGVLLDPRAHADRLAEVRAAAGGALFVNARVDSFLRGVADPAEAIARARLCIPSASRRSICRCCAPGSRGPSTWRTCPAVRPSGSWGGWVPPASRSARG